jgi:DNA-cytosine methyltransferase
MAELRSLLHRIVAGGSRDDRVALLLSAGIDSISTGIACEEAGKKVQAYTFELKGYRSREREKVEKIAQHLGWPLKVITVPTLYLPADFKRLAIQHGCWRKVLFEVLFPLLYVFPEIDEHEVWTGFNADDHYGNTREPKLQQARLIRQGASPTERKQAFDEYRRTVYEKFWKLDSGDSFWFAKRLAASYRKDLLDPYMDDGVRHFFAAFDHAQLSPPTKPIVRQAFADRLDGLPDDAIAKDVKLQLGGRVDELFQQLIADLDTNRFETKYTDVAALCQRWGREVEANPAAFAAELTALPQQPRASVRASPDNGYRPYLIVDVRNASAAAKFIAVSTFAGGGGSSTGYRLAGGYVPLVNEFVPEAAHTYKRNFPECIVDQRDIREISASDEAVAAFLASAGLAVGELDLLDGSPPCSEFSTAGRGIGDQDVQKSYSDVTQNNIASLPFDLIDVAIRAKPKVFVCENVPAFASRGKEVFERVLRALRFPGDRAYYANWQVLTASDFGVPQKRQRLFIIGVRKDVGDLIGIDSDEAVLDVFPVPTRVGMNVRSAFEGLRQSHGDVWPWTRSAMTPSLRKLIRLLPKNPPKPTRLAHIFPDYKSNYTLTRCAWDKPAPTMVVSGQRPDGMTGAIHPEHDRKFTLPELKRLTGLPDDFILTGTFGQASERICRMVPPLLTKAIAESIYEAVLKPYKEKNV